VTKANLRWQGGLALLCLAVVASLLYWGQPTAAGDPPRPLPLLNQPTPPPDEPTNTCLDPAAQWLYEGIVGAPRHLNPLLSEGNPVDQELVDLLFDGLLRYDERGRLAPALAQEWAVSEDGLRVIFTLRPDGVWHDGQPVTAADVAFTYGLLQDEAFPAAQRDKALWRAVQIEVLNEQMVQFTLPEPYAPFLAATTRGILPAHAWAGTTAATLAENPLNSQPIGTGPLQVVGDWRTNGQLTLVPNPATSGAWALAGVVYRFYPSEGELLAAFERGEVQAVSRLSAEAIPPAAVLEGMRLFSDPLPRYTQLLFNLSETGFAGLQDVAVRQALAQGLDKQGLITAALNGQALPFEGPYLPSSAAYDPNMPAPIPFNPELAAQGLSNAGWVEGAGTNSRVGGAEGQTPFVLRLLVLDDPEQQRLAAELSWQWAAVGVATEVRTADGETLAASLRDRAFDVALVTIMPAADPDLYDFWSQDGIVRGQNYAAWNNRRASEALEAARQVWNQEDRLAYYRAFLQFYAEGLPAITLYQPVMSYGVHEVVEGVEIGLLTRPRDHYATAAQWALPAADGCE
jgi:peptide/nickel transport system substrate-binding protein